MQGRVFASGRGPAVQHPSSSAQARTITHSTGLRASYTYDDAGRLVGAGHGDGKSLIYTYVFAGNLLRSEVVAEVHVYLPIVLKSYVSP